MAHQAVTVPGAERSGADKGVAGLLLVEVTGPECAVVQVGALASSQSWSTMNRRMGSGSPSRVSALAVDRASGQLGDHPLAGRTTRRSVMRSPQPEKQSSAMPRSHGCQEISRNVKYQVRGLLEGFLIAGVSRCRSDVSLGGTARPGSQASELPGLARAVASVRRLTSHSAHRHVLSEARRRRH